MNRRRFLRHSSAGLTLAALPRTPGTARSAIPLGFSLYGMKSLPIEDALRVCSEIGYSHVELTLMPGYPTEPALLSAAARTALRGLLAKHGLGVSGLMENLRLAAEDAEHRQNLDRIRAAAELAHTLAPENPPIVESVLGGNPDEWDAIQARMVERARDWTRVAEENGITFCIKPHVLHAVDSPARLLWLHQQVASPALKLCYDYSHFQIQGMELEATLLPLIADTRFIHLKDAAGDPRDVRFLLPGEGETNYRQYATLLRNHHWDGPVVVEVSSMVFRQPGHDPVAAARTCFNALAPAFGTSGDDHP